MNNCPTRDAVERRIRSACDALTADGVIAVGWPTLDADSSGVIDLCVELDGIDIDKAGRLLSEMVGCVVAPCVQSVDHLAENGPIVDAGNWIYQPPTPPEDERLSASLRRSQSYWNMFDDVPDEADITLGDRPPMP